MVSMTGVTSGQAASYYQKDNYYTQEQGQWQGKGAETLGLGEFTEKNFTEMIAGFKKDSLSDSEHTALKGLLKEESRLTNAYEKAEKIKDADVRDEKLASLRDEINAYNQKRADFNKLHEDKKQIQDACNRYGIMSHRAGIDLTFSAPKSVSIASEVLGDSKVRDAHDKAVAETLRYVENNYSQARQTASGVTEKVDTCNLVIAKFEHNTSRELDPQLHTHAVVMNMTQREDGQWRALSNEEIYDNKMLIGQIYRNELAANLKEHGYSIQSDAKGFFEIQGIDQKVLDHFSQRTEQINAKVQELKESGLYQNANEQKLKEIATLGSRASKKDVDMNAVKESWQDRLKEQGYTKEQLQENIQKATEQAKQNELNRTNPKMTEYDIVRQSAKIQTEQESTFSKEDVLKTAGKLSVGEHRIGDLGKAFNELNKDKELKQLDKNVYTTKEMQKIEKENVEIMQKVQNTKNAIFTKEHAQEAIKAYEQSKGFAMTNCQKNAVEHILTSRDRIIGIQGDAGTGKTTSLSVVREQLEKAGYVVRGLGFTGKAASEIEQAAGIKSQTLHSFLNSVSQKDNFSKTTVWAGKNGEKFTSFTAIKDNVKTTITMSETGRQSVSQTRYKNGVAIKNTLSSDGRQTWAKKEAGESTFKQIQSFFIKAESAVREMSGMQDIIKKFEQESIFYKIDQMGLGAAVSKFENQIGINQNTINSLFKSFDAAINRAISDAISGKKNESNYKLETGKAEKVAAGKEVWIVDESSMTGSKQTNELLRAAEKADARVVMIGDTKQLQSISAGRAFQDLQSAGMNTVRMSEVLRQKDEQYKDIVKNISEKQIDQAFDKLEKQERITEITSRSERLEAIKNDYMSSKGNTIIVTATNKDRNELNDRIHAELKERGKIGKEDYTFTVRESKGISPESKHFAQSYSVGDRIVAGKAGIIGRAGAEGKVTAVDQLNHKITVQTKDNRQHQIDLKSQGEHLSAYKEKEQSFSQGEKIVFLKNDKGRGIKNGQAGTIQSIDKNGNAKIKMENGKIKDINIKTQYSYVDRGYAVTDYKSQGQTADKVIYHADTSKKSNYNQAYVAMTRGKEDLRIYTDNKENLKEQIKNEQVKTSTLDHEKGEKVSDKTSDKTSETMKQASKTPETKSESERVMDRARESAKSETSKSVGSGKEIEKSR